MFLCGEESFFSHSLTHSFTRLCDFLLWRGYMIFFWRLHDFCCGEVLCFFEVK